MRTVPEIVFPSGSSGNHLRWLLSLDPTFNMSDCPDIKQRPQWIKDNIYSRRRWNNWLEYEWRYRTDLDKVLKVTHSISEPGDSYQDTSWQNLKQLVLTPHDLQSVGMHYYMLNIGMNNATYDRFISMTTYWIKTVDSVKKLNLPTKLFLPSDPLHQLVLDREWYNTVINFFGYSDQYELAAELQEYYFQTRVRATKQFLEYFTGEEFNNHLNFYREFVKQHE